jgi:hypothetical protein
MGEKKASKGIGMSDKKIKKENSTPRYKLMFVYSLHNIVLASPSSKNELFSYMEEKKEDNKQTKTINIEVELTTHFVISISTLTTELAPQPNDE